MYLFALLMFFFLKNKFLIEFLIQNGVLNITVYWFNTMDRFTGFLVHECLPQATLT